MMIFLQSHKSNLFGQTEPSLLLLRCAFELLDLSVGDVVKLVLVQQLSRVDDFFLADLVVWQLLLYIFVRKLI